MESSQKPRDCYLLLTEEEANRIIEICMPEYLRLLAQLDETQMGFNLCMAKGRLSTCAARLDKLNNIRAQAHAYKRRILFCEDIIDLRKREEEVNVMSGQGQTRESLFNAASGHCADISTTTRLDTHVPHDHRNEVKESPLKLDHQRAERKRKNRDEEEEEEEDEEEPCAKRRRVDTAPFKRSAW